MLFITILPSVGQTVLRSAVLLHIQGAGCEIAPALQEAHFVVGLADGKWPEIPDNQKIILVETGKSGGLPPGSVLFNVCTLTSLAKPTVSLMTYLRSHRPSES